MSNKCIGIEGAESAPQFQFVETGIYRKSTNDVYYERPKVNGKRTWRSLATSNLKHAREELHRRRAANASAVGRSNARLSIKTLVRAKMELPAPPTSTRTGINGNNAMAQARPKNS